MEQVREALERYFDSDMLPDLLSGMGGLFPSGLVFERNESFGKAVAVAAKRSVVCAESGLRGLLYHLPLLLQAIDQTLQQHQGLRGSGNGEGTADRVDIRGDESTGVVVVQHRLGRAIVTPTQWLGSEVETAESQLPPTSTPRSSPWVEAAQLAIKIVELLGWQVDMDSTQTTSGCFMDVTNRHSMYSTKVRVKKDNTANHADTGSKRMLLVLEMRPSGGAFKVKVQEQKGYAWEVRGKGEVHAVGEGGEVYAKMRELCTLVSDGVPGGMGGGKWEGEERKFRDRMAKVKKELEKEAVEAAGGGGSGGTGAGASTSASGGGNGGDGGGGGGGVGQSDGLGGSDADTDADDNKGPVIGNE
jgi:hypothetical protein